jgi:hypothetical protein
VDAPEGGSQESTVQALPSSQSTGWVGVQAPSIQVSPPAQAFPSSQGAWLLAYTQPDAGSQLSSVHGFPSSQTMGSLMHPPSGSQLSAVQAFPSSQAVVTVTCALQVSVAPWMSLTVSVTSVIPTG